MAQRVQRILYATDFDWSFADQDTDRYVFEVLAPELRTSLREGKKTTQWTDNVYVSARLGVLAQADFLIRSSVAQNTSSSFMSKELLSSRSQSRFKISPSYVQSAQDGSNDERSHSFLH